MDLNRCWPQSEHTQARTGGIFDAEQHINAVIMNALRCLHITHLTHRHDHIVCRFCPLTVLITIKNMLTMIVGIHFKMCSIHVGYCSCQQIRRRLRKEIRTDKAQFNFSIGGRWPMLKIGWELIF